MKKFAFAGIALFIISAFILFAQQGHGDGENTFFFTHKVVLGIVSLVVAAIIGAITIKIPKQ